MLVDMKGAKSIVDMDSFCIDGSGSTTEVFTQYVEGEDYPDVFEFAHYSGNERDQTAVICYPENGHKEVPEVTLPLVILQSSKNPYFYYR